MKNHLTTFFLAALSGIAAVPNAGAGLININLTNMTSTGTGPDGDGILGGGTWNRIEWMDADENTALVDSDANALAGVTAKDAAFPSGFDQVNDNAVQDESWGTPVDLTVSGLIADQVYKVAVYSDRIGSGGLGGTNTYTVNGISEDLPKPGEAATVLPGVEDIDYALFIVDASATGTIVIQAPLIAGIQIEGVLPGEDGPQPDARIARTGSQEGKGDGIYSATPVKSQTLTQRTTGKRARRYYVNVHNSGAEVDRFYLMGWWQKKKTKVKVIDLDSGGNVTGQTLARSYRYQLCKEETQRFKIIVKSKMKERGTLKVRIGAAPSTLSGDRRDTVVAETKVVP